MNYSKLLFICALIIGTPAIFFASTTVVMSVVAHNVTTYQWMKNDQPIPGANQPTLTVKMTDRGVYRCVVSNNGGQVSTQPVQIQVSRTGQQASVVLTAGVK